MNSNLNIITLQRELATKIASLNLSDHLYAKRPRVLDAKVSDFIVVRVSTNVYDRRAYGEAIVSLDLYVKDLKDGVTIDSDKLAAINTTLLNNLPFDTEHYHFSYLNATPTVDDGSGFTYQIINIQTLINT